MCSVHHPIPSRNGEKPTIFPVVKLLSIFSRTTEKKKLIAFICNRRTLHRWDGKQIKNKRMMLLRIWRISYNKLVSSLSCARLSDSRVHIPYYINRLKFHSLMKYNTKEVFTPDSFMSELNQLRLVGWMIGCLICLVYCCRRRRCPCCSYCYYYFVNELLFEIRRNDKTFLQLDFPWIRCEMLTFPFDTARKHCTSP